MATALFIVFPISEIGYSQRAEESLGVRELCRSKISGLYLSHLDRYQRHKEFLEMVEIKALQTSTSLQMAERSLEAAKLSIQNAAYDQDKIEHYELQRSRTANLKEASDQHANLVIKAQNQTADAKQSFFSLNEKLISVFTISEEKTSEGSYPFLLHYKSPCPEYRNNCPLPKIEADHLKTILGEQTPIECIRYGNHR
jgi:hypothetical protein